MILDGNSQLGENAFIQFLSELELTALRIDVATLTRAWIFRRLATAATRKLTQCYVSYLFAHLPDLNQRGVVVRRGLESQTGDGSRGQRTDACVFDFV